MTYKIIVKPEAEAELVEALQWYDEKKHGLGAKLYQDILEVIQRIEKNPQHFQKRYKNFYIGFTKRFRYGIHFTIENEVIFIHAFLHTSKKPRT